jgi:hypothetical protein
VRRLVLLGALFLMAIPAHAQDPQRALRPEPADLLGLGRVRADFSVEFDQRARYSLSGLEGDLLRLGILNFRVGVGEYAEFQISGVGRDFLSVTKRSTAVIPTTFSGDNTSDFGDLVLGTKLKLVSERGSRPALSFKFAVQLPNASNERGLGADEIEFYSSLLCSKHLGRAEFTGNLGLAILGSPVQTNSQADMLTYGAGIIIPLHPKVELVAELSGRQGPQRIGNENLAQARAGARIHAAGLRWDFMGMAGLRHFDPKSGLALGVSYEFQAFHKKQGPVTVKPPKPGK